MNTPNNKLLIKPLILTALLTTLLMTSYEIIKQLIYTEITIWESHLITIIFTTFLAVSVTYFALRKYHSLLKILSGFISICSDCRKIQDGKENWVSVEAYIRKHSNAEFSHGLCPKCYKKCIDKIENM
jgi:hypothetical protein